MILVGQNSTDFTKTTLYTKGGQFSVESTGQEYRGEYHFANGIPFTGKPKNPQAQRLLPYFDKDFNGYCGNGLCFWWYVDNTKHGA